MDGLFVSNSSPMDGMGCMLFPWEVQAMKKEIAVWKQGLAVDHHFRWNNTLRLASYPWCSATIWRTAEEIACWSYATDLWRGHEEDVARGKWDYWRFHWSHEPLAVYSCNPQLHWSIQGGLNDIEHGGNGLHKKRECEQDEENCKRFFKDFLETYHVLEKEPFLHNFETRQMVQRIWQRRRKRSSLCPWPTFQMMAKAMLYIILNDWKLLKDAAMRLAALSGVISTLKTAL